MNAEGTTGEVQHICVCICTYKRPLLLRRLLEGLGVQETSGFFTFSIVIVDNDRLESAKRVVEDFMAASPIRVTYCVEPRRNIALARNKAVESAKGDFVAFIDDDEFPTKEWLLLLFKACGEYHVDGVLGPVKPYFSEVPPKWVVKGKLFERPTYETGHVINWRESRTGNVLLKKQILDELDDAFRPEFGTGGEDVDFFRRMIRRGLVFVWCNEAEVLEVVPAARYTRMYLVRRALLRGRNSIRGDGRTVSSVCKAVVAIPLYGLGLPFLFLTGHHHFMKVLIKFCDHAGRLLALIGLSPVQVRDA